MTDDESGLYLNHRGLKDGPDKYGKQVRGAKIVVSNDNDSDPFTQKAFNGYYFYIDRILAYDQTTRDDVLGSELWRVDFKALSPDIMNNAESLRGIYWREFDGPDYRPGSQWGCNYIYPWDCIENITANKSTVWGDALNYSIGLVAQRAHASWWCWQGDLVEVFGPFDITIKLPPLPVGEWEVRMGVCGTGVRPAVRVYLNGQVTVDSLNLAQTYVEGNPNLLNGPRECLFFYTWGMNLYRFSEQENGVLVRHKLGRIQSDGKSDNYLRLEYLWDEKLGNNTELMLDYFEFVPKAVYDNPDVPEE